MSDGLFDGVLAAGPVARLVEDRAWVQAMLDFEGALALSSAEAGVIPEQAALEIEKHCLAVDYDIAALGAAAATIGNPAGPLVRELARRAGAYVHLGATSQDVIDTAAMVVTARALDALIVELRCCADLLDRLAEEHLETVMAGRTLLQQALPTTFGLVSACWLSGVACCYEQVARVRGRLAVQFGGAVGTLAALRDNGIPVLAGVARRLGLAEPVLPWHTERGRIAEIAGALGQVSGAVAKVARDIVLLAQTEVGEVREGGPAGGSSTMPHKRNPIAAVLAASAAAQAPGLVATLLGAAAHEHQRAAGAWHAEWRPLTELLRGTGSAVHWLRRSLERLVVDPARMRVNLDARVLTEHIVTELVSISAMGRQEAVDLIAAHADSGDPVERLVANPAIGRHLTHRRIAELLDPTGYLGCSAQFVDRARAEWSRLR
ncbi:3-carboxy-cis,cis-muconate cycloisomerase [Nocardia panacis]|uniref:3-carboxy-cis,cis-muconate cycloisomerase n=1 Tax=Nocardia panacis TaxID=2340916 RepID=A0A3A4KSW8_9NOCA|nr:3-carboxy-cis,cis-muconate cycloisomerase [Nocardia panacis]RJO79225.1 3-carboxy-cis,cis-muconate cycloisomerase [Nocardia panacis]